jgi:hypothetical protein
MNPKMNFIKILVTLLSKNLINLTTKIFRSTSNIFWTEDFVHMSEQEILPLKVIPKRRQNCLENPKRATFYKIK